MRAPLRCLSLGFLVASAPAVPKTRCILDAVRAAGLWLLMASVFLAPAGLGASAGGAPASSPCGVFCPCDEALGERALPAGELIAQTAASSDRGESDPCGDPCPINCRDCGCCARVAMAVFSLPGMANGGSASSARLRAPAEAPKSGATGGVFRPPRSLT
jgi:hypothetical protein